MTSPDFTSGDPRLDRRAEYAEAMHHAGDPQAAADVIRSALDEAPLWLAGWVKLAQYLEAAEQTEAAKAAWQHLLTLDPSDPFGAALHLDLTRDTGLVEGMPPAFVENLFDQYAPRFETSLVGKLNYQGPQLLLDALLHQGRSQFGSTLDLGCGTGLIGQTIRPHTGRLTGIDLSAAMLDQARAKGIYDRLEKADIACLPLTGPQYDLILAADVFIYLGALERVTAWAVTHLNPGGIFAFTLEKATDPEADVTLLPCHRFAHSIGYVTSLLEQAGFTPPDLREATLRQDRGVDVAGLIVTTSLPPSRTLRESDGEDLATA